MAEVLKEKTVMAFAITVFYNLLWLIRRLFVLCETFTAVNRSAVMVSRHHGAEVRGDFSFVKSTLHNNSSFGTIKLYIFKSAFQYFSQYY